MHRLRCVVGILLLTRTPLPRFVSSPRPLVSGHTGSAAFLSHTSLRRLTFTPFSIFRAANVAAPPRLPIVMDTPTSQCSQTADPLHHSCHTRRYSASPSHRCYDTHVAVPPCLSPSSIVSYHTRLRSASPSLVFVSHTSIHRLVSHWVCDAHLALPNLQHQSCHTHVAAPPCLPPLQFQKSLCKTHEARGRTLGTTHPVVLSAPQSIT